MFALRLIGLLLCMAVIGGCQRDLLTTDPDHRLDFSTDTLTFDTVFTSLGSATRYFVIRNPNDKKIRISSLRLAGGTLSPFRLNVDGQPATELSDVELPAGDSIYVFVAVTINPNDENNPFVVYDSVVMETNGNLQRVVLQAWGQNAHFFYASIIGTQDWYNDKPYVIIHSILVDTQATLTIHPGCRIYLHADSRFYVAGTLRVLGQPGDSVVFRGDRLEPYFVDLPGNWQGIHLLKTSKDNVVEYAVIKESIVGIRVDSLKVTAYPKLTLRNSIIRLTLSSGLLGITADIYAENCLIHSCGEWNVQLEYGGNYEFQNCTFANASTIVTQHQKPVLRMSNYYYYRLQGVDYYLPADLNATFGNCIIYGTLNNELDRDAISGAAFNYSFRNCLMQLADTVNINQPQFVDVIKNANPLFVSPDYEKQDYRLQAQSPCIDAGYDNGVLTDLDGRLRTPPPDIGCYEFF
ncbi:MAG: choice-of-anchor Q domain-containing protein [Chitinophagales bacterium]|nr:hypothetical protein [Chitinophagales bacterium]MDW8393036.1 choice-of-anchor Q domain-containing protein [Chitinophagales bacterium]